MFKSRPTTQGPFVTGQPALLRGRPPWVDQTRNVKLIGEALQRESADNKPRIIGIQGVCGAGKTRLATVLAKTGANVSLIEVLKHRHLAPGRSYDVSPLLADATGTYVIDEAGYAHQASLSGAVLDITARGATVVLLFQRFRELDRNLLSSMVQFDLLRGSLIERPAELRFVVRRHTEVLE